MRHTRVALFVHLIWATWDRLPLLTGERQRRIYRAMQASCHDMGVEVLALGGVEDHVHVLVRIPATIAIAELVKELKGGSAHLATHVITPDAFFKWQGGYAAFSVSLSQLSAVRHYVTHQREHHASNTLIPE